MHDDESDNFPADATITSMKPRGRNKLKVEIYLDGEPWERLDIETVVREGIGIGTVLDASAREALLNTNAKIIASQKASAHQATRPRTEKEIEFYLRQRDFDQTSIDHALENLRDKEMLDDNRVAEHHTQRRVREGKSGPRKIQAELHQRGVDRDATHAAMKDMRERVDFDEICLEQARKALRKYQPLSDHKNRTRLMQFLMRRGFEHESIRKVVDQLKREAEAEHEE